MKRLLIFVLCVSFVGKGICFDLTTLKGVEYKQCEIIRVEPNGIIFMHSKGIAKISFENLPKEYQLKYGYDEVKAVFHESKRKLAEEEYWAKRKAMREAYEREMKKANAEFWSKPNAEEAFKKSEKLKYAGKYSVSEAKKKVAKLKNKAIKLTFRSIGDICETSGGYEVVMYDSLFKSANSIGISAIFPAEAIGWLSSVTKVPYRKGGRLSIGDVYEAGYAEKRAYWVYGKLEAKGILRLNPLGVKKTSQGYSW